MKRIIAILLMLACAAQAQEPTCWLYMVQPGNPLDASGTGTPAETGVMIQLEVADEKNALELVDKLAKDATRFQGKNYLAYLHTCRHYQDAPEGCSKTLIAEHYELEGFADQAEKYMRVEEVSPVSMQPVIVQLAVVDKADYDAKEADVFAKEFADISNTKISVPEEIAVAITAEAEDVK
jgi:hypothetical protein